MIATYIVLVRDISRTNGKSWPRKVFYQLEPINPGLSNTGIFSGLCPLWNPGSGTRSEDGKNRGLTE